MNNKNLKTENFWIVIIWAVVFMLILAWDQEKIVVLNLILFCYFLYFLVGDSINSTLAQRRQLLLEGLLVDITTQLNVLRTLLSDSKVALTNYNLVILSILKKVSNTVNNLFISLRTTTNSFAYNTNFSFISQVLQTIYDGVNLKELSQNTFVASQITLDVSPILSEEETVTE